MKDAYQTNHWIKTHGDLALDLVRMYLGIGLIIKSVYFMNHTDYLLHELDSMGSLWFAPAIMVHYVILAHLVGGICLLFGLLTRAAAVVQLPILAVALFGLHLQQMGLSVEARQSVELDGLVLFLLAVISVYGAGRFSLDHWLGKREFERLFEADANQAKTG